MCELGDGVTQRFTRIKLKLLVVSSIFRSYFLCSMNQQVPTIQSNANASDFTFTREEFESAPTRQLLRNGRAANAIVWRLRKNGITWTVKDFSKRSWFVRTFIGPFLIRRELAALSRLKNINGIAGRAFRIDRSAMAVEFLEGDSLERIAPERITVEYLCQLEDLISQMHSRGVVHLDLRGLGNVLVRPDGTPGLIDFQAAMCTNHWPKGLRRILEAMDVSGALKRWNYFHPEAMGKERLERLEAINSVRRFWIFQGYFGIKRKKNQKKEH